MSSHVISQQLFILGLRIVHIRYGNHIVKCLCCLKYVAMIRSPALLLAYDPHLPIIMPGLASHHPQTLSILMRSTCGMFRHRLHVMLSGHLTLLTQTLHLMPCHCEMDLQAVWKSCGTTRLAQRRALSTRCVWVRGTHARCCMHVCAQYPGLKFGADSHATAVLESLC